VTLGALRPASPERLKRPARRAEMPRLLTSTADA